MKIRTIPSESKKVEVPFVVGGVYRLREEGSVRILIRRGHLHTDHYAWLDPLEGSAAWTGWLHRSQIDISGHEYLPDAELVIPE